MTDSRFMLDTNMASAVIRGQNAALRDRLRAAPMARLCLSAVTKAELLYGVARKPQAASLATVVNEFLARLDVLAWDDAAAGVYGALRANLERRGLPMGSLDMMIAAHALAVRAVLVTNDKAFRRVEKLAVEDWTTPPETRSHRV